VWFFFEIHNAAAAPRTYDLTATSTMQWPVRVQSFIRVAAQGSESVLVTVDVPGEVLSPARLDVQLCARNRTSGLSLCKQTRLAVAVRLEDFEAASDGGGVALRWVIHDDGAETGEIVVQRARVDRGELGEFSARARLPIDSGAWRDADVESGATYAYRLVIAGPAGAELLGERTVTVAAPGRSRLLGNAPNPFNPATRVRFELARHGDVQLTIYDVRGRIVRSIRTADLLAGAHALAWDGHDGAGRPLPSGLYLYEIRSDSWTARGRMTLAK
jgi:hypothetical protein